MSKNHKRTARAREIMAKYPGTRLTQALHVADRVHALATSTNVLPRHALSWMTMTANGTLDDPATWAGTPASSMVRWPRVRDPHEIDEAMVREVVRDAPDAGASRTATGAGAISAPNHQALAAEMVKLRRSRGMTLDDLTAASGVSRRALVGLERGQSDGSIRTWARVAAGLGVPVGTLLAHLDDQGSHPDS